MEFSFSKSQRFYLVVKRAIDIFGSAFAIILLSLLIIFCAVMTKITSKGPVFFKQKRVGKNKKMFTLLKFRSMRVDAAQVAPSDISEATQKDMTTKWGKFIRKTSLDEIPQLFNIFVGSMSFIGPRPSQGEDVEGELIRDRSSYEPSAYLVKPGVGGYAQVKMRRGHDPHEKARLDSYYVAHLSLGLDTKIFILSFLSLLGINKGR